MKTPRRPFADPVLLVTVFAALAGCSAPAAPARLQTAGVAYYGYEVVAAYPHDALAFTQGLTFDDGFLYEGTGLVGRSSLRRVELETGTVVASVPLPEDWFGEGITVCGDRLVQLTWRNGVGRVYDRRDLRVLGDFALEGEGWGITWDGGRLIVSDGTSTLRFLDPDTFATKGSVEVRESGVPVEGLNELEFIDGRVYANVWPFDRLAVIDPGDGSVTGWADLSGLLASRPVSSSVDVMNGIAWDGAKDRLFVTGKLWPWLFELRLAPGSRAAVP
jgi:glutamine cyclotransferase